MAFMDSFYHLSVTSLHTLHAVEDWFAHGCDVSFIALSTGGGEFRLASGAARFDNPIICESC